MPNSWTDKWDNRYRQPEYAYGTQPNAYFKTQLESLPVGKILLPAEGEGRNAVFAAQLGWEVVAFDLSAEGHKKAMLLAEENRVHFAYHVGDLSVLSFPTESFDALGLIYAHFPAAIKASYHRQLAQTLRVGGHIIFEAFSKRHLEYNTRNEQVGGPKDLDSLFSVEELRADFPNFMFLELQETEVELSEGKYHLGLGSVIRCVAKKMESRS